MVLNGKKFIDALKTKMGARNEKALSEMLGITLVTLNNWKNELTLQIVVRLVGRLAKERITGTKIIVDMQRHLKAPTQASLANKLGISSQAIQNWKNQSVITSRQLAGIVKSASNATKENLGRTAIQPLVEFCHIERCSSKQNAKYEMFSIKNKDGDQRTYYKDLKEELEKAHGVYIFFDSRGQAIYAGKARIQSLWKEMTEAFNRNRGSVQQIKRVQHPTRQQSYKTAIEKARQIRGFAVPLHELADYFSAYEVSDNLIQEIEAMLVRGFANDLLNKRMEMFGNQKNQKKRKKPSRRKHDGKRLMKRR